MNINNLNRKKIIRHLSNHTHHAISLPKADKHASTMNINYVKRATVNTLNDPQIDYVIFSYFSALIRPLT